VGLAQCLTSLRSLTSLDISDNPVQAAGADAVAAALPYLQRLRHLDLAGTALGFVGLASLGPALQYLTGLTSLNLGNNGLGLDEGGEGLRPLVRAAPALSSLTRLVISRNRLQGPAVAVLGEALARWGSSLRHLNLSRNPVRDDGMEDLVRRLRHLTALTHLDLSDTGVADAGTSALASCIRRKFLPNLKHLFLHFNSIGDSGAAELLQALATMQTLAIVDLDLSRNPVGDQAFMAVGHDVTRLTALTRLDLSLTSVTEPTIGWLSTALPSLSALGSVTAAVTLTSSPVQAGRPPLL